MKSLLIILIIGFEVVAYSAFSQALPDGTKVTKIYSDENYNAFTSLLKFKGKFYCAFRSGEAHVYGKDGIVKIISSRSGEKWKEVAIISATGYDLRDPKLSITPDGRIMVIMGGSIYEGKNLIGGVPHVSFSNKNATSFSAPKPTNIDSKIKTNFDWLWQLTWHNRTGYGVIYKMNEQSKSGDSTSVTLVKTTNGIDYQMVSELRMEGRPTEATIRLMSNGEMLMMIRRSQGNKKAYIGKSKTPYTNWTYKEVPFFVGGPDFIEFKDNYYIGGGRVKGEFTGLFSFTNDGHIKNILRLPSNSDSSYPGLAIEGDMLFVSYYSSHETQKTSIYFAKVPLSYFKIKE